MAHEGTTLFDSRVDEDSPAALGPTQFQVLVIEAERTRTFALASGDAFTIGRADDATVIVPDAGVSRQHARIGLRGDRLFVRDLGSRNGTRVGDEVLKDAERPLPEGLAVTVGSVRIVATRVLASPPAVAAGATPRLADGFVVNAPEMLRLLAVTARAARLGTSVLLTGETGVGKEMLAQQIQLFSGAPTLVRVNCASLPPTLLESELFGHERGAFTGASDRRAGFLEQASGGWLFLDEIGELPLGAQAALLRAIETKTITRVGSTRELPIDVRFVFATNRELAQEVSAGRFRRDLFYRINTVTVRVPPLRERPTEIAPLAMLFIRQMAARTAAPERVLSLAALERLQRHSWPGNVRELRNAIEHAHVVSDAAVITPAELPPDLEAVTPAPAPTASASSALADVERQHVVEALRLAGNNRTKAAQRLGISRFALLRKLEKYGIREE